MGTLLRTCVKVHEPIKLSFGIVSGVGPGTDVLDGSPHTSRGRGCFGSCLPHLPNGFNGIFLTEMYSTRK